MVLPASSPLLLWSNPRYRDLQKEEPHIDVAGQILRCYANALAHPLLQLNQISDVSL